MQESYTVRTSKYYRYFALSLYIFINLIFLIGFIICIIFIQKDVVIGILFLFLSALIPPTSYFSYRYYFSKISFSENNIILTSHIARKIDLKWDELKTYGVILKPSCRAIPETFIYYFSKVNITKEAILSKGLKSNNNIIFVITELKILKDIKPYIPKQIFDKITLDLTLMKYPVDSELL